MQNFNKFAAFLTLFLTRVGCFSVNQIFGVETSNFDRSQNEAEVNKTSITYILVKARPPVSINDSASNM